jgi:hypothetical protein
MVMRGHKQNRGTSEIDLWVAVAAYALGLLIIVLGTPLHAQTFEVLHAFDLEGYLLSGVTMDAQGNLYGATTGIVYKLTRRG